MAAVLLVAACSGGGAATSTSAPQSSTTTTRPVAAATHETDDRPSSLIVAGGLLWVGRDETPSVVVVDPESGDPVTDPIDLGRDPKRIVTDGVRVYVALLLDRQVAAIDVESREVAWVTDPLGDEVVAMGVDPSGVVWAGGISEGLVFRIDGETGAVLGEPTDVGSGAVRLAIGEGRVWVTTRDEGTVVPIDLDTGAAGEAVAVGDTPIGIAVDNGEIWVVDAFDLAVRAVDATSGETIGDPVAVDGGPVEIVLDDDRAYVLGQEGRRIVVLDRATRTIVTEVHLEGVPRAAAFDDDGMLWVATAQPPGLYVIDPASLE